MIKSLKMLAVILIIMGIGFFIGGNVFSNLAEEHRGTPIQTGYTVNGEYVYTGVTYKDRNMEAAKSADSAAGAFYTFGIVFLCAGGILLIVALKKKITKTVYKRGVILEKNSNGNLEFVIVEFEDNSRMKLVVEPPLIVAQGDKGRFGYKNKSLIEFVKE